MLCSGMSQTKASLGLRGAVSLRVKHLWRSWQERFKGQVAESGTREDLWKGLDISECRGEIGTIWTKRKRTKGTRTCLE